MQTHRSPRTRFLRMVVDPDGEMTTLTCAGLTWKTTAAFRAAVAGLPKTGGIIFDLRGDRTDAAGTAAMICAVLDLTAKGQPVALLVGSGLERAVLRTTGLGQVARMVSTVEEGRSALRSEPSVIGLDDRTADRGVASRA